MFRHKRQQRSLFDHDVYLPDERVAALDKTWAGPFRRNILPLIDEDPFESFYCPDNGRPNIPVSILIGLCILKEWHNLSDAELLGSLEWDIRWQYALDINMDEADISQKTLHNFRSLVANNNMAARVFADITGKIIRQAGLSTARQRLDSTHITSNMANLSRLALFVRTIEKFLARLKKTHPEAFSRLPSLYAKAYLDRAGYFADAKSSKARRRLEKSARHLFDLVDRFRGDETVARMHSYKLMARLLDEQCEIAEGETAPVALKKPSDISAESLQNPSDPDAAYGRKGKGYKASLTETCDKENEFQVITDVAVDKVNHPDAKDVPPVLDRLEGADAKPDELFADAGYGSSDNLLHAQDNGVDLVAPMTSGARPGDQKVNFDDFDFDADWTCVERCLKGHAPVRSGRTPNGKNVFAIFDADACGRCDLKPLCRVTHHKNGTFRLRIPIKTVVASHRRREQETGAFKERYKIRSGIEATISEAQRLTSLLKNAICGVALHFSSVQRTVSTPYSSKFARLASHRFLTGCKFRVFQRAVTSLKRSWTRGHVRVASSVCFKALAINVKRYVQREVEKARKAGERALYLLKSGARRPLLPLPRHPGPLSRQLVPTLPLAA